MEQQGRLMLRDGAMAIGMSIILYMITASATLFIIPLLFVAPRFQDVRRSLIPVLVVLVMVVSYNLIQVYDQLGIPVIRGSLAVGMYIPIALLVGAGVWIGLPKQGMLVRLIVASLFAAIAGFLLVLWFRGGSESALDTAKSFKAIFELLVSQLLGSSLAIGVEVETIYSMTVRIVELSFLPLFVGQFGLSVLISELLIHKGDWDYQERMTHWHLPENAIWVLLIAWTVVLATKFVVVPIVACVAWNIALLLTLLYIVQGIAISAFFIRKRNPKATATRTFVMLSLLAIMPGLNVIPLIALPLLGVSETWIRFRLNT